VPVNPSFILPFLKGSKCSPFFVGNGLSYVPKCPTIPYWKKITWVKKHFDNRFVLH